MDGPLKIVKFGRKEIYLPKFTVALIRTPKLSPYHAKFQVPLNFSKFDLRDYLFHAYNVRALSIRSFVQQQPVRDSIQNPRQWFRPQAKKFMTIEMDQPFVWPEAPEDLEPWGRKIKEQQEDEAVDDMTDSAKKKMHAAKTLREQAKALMKGKKAGLGAWEEARTDTYVESSGSKYKIRV